MELNEPSRYDCCYNRTPEVEVALLHRTLFIFFQKVFRHIGSTYVVAILHDNNRSTFGQQL